MFFVATTSTHTYVRWLLWFLVVFNQHLGASMWEIQEPAGGAARLAGEVRKRISIMDLILSLRTSYERQGIWRRLAWYLLYCILNRLAGKYLKKVKLPSNPAGKYLTKSEAVILQNTATLSGQSHCAICIKGEDVMILLWGASLAVVYNWWVCCRHPRSNFIDDTKDFKKNYLFKILDVFLDIIGFIRKKKDEKAKIKRKFYWLSAKGYHCLPFAGHVVYSIHLVTVTERGIRG